ncbi:MAG: Rpn family recombination-promoting nuclease/putative transposase [Clostridia bacterium]
MSIAEQKSKEEVKLLKPKNDIVFQCLFNQNNERITKAFVQALLDEQIDKIVINNDKDLFRETPENKLGILDLQLDINNNEKVDVEIQLINNDNLQDRLLYYFSRLYASQINIGEDYKTSKKIILVAILDYKFDVTKEIKEFETIWQLCESQNPEKILTDKIEIHIIELEKVRNTYEQNKENKKAQWMLFLDDPNSKEVQEIMKENEDVKEAVVEVHKMTEDEKVKRLAELRQKAIMDEKAYYRTGVRVGLEDGLERGLKQGKEQGIQQRNQEIARKLLKRNMAIEEISEITGIAVKEIEEISKNMK